MKILPCLLLLLSLGVVSAAPEPDALVKLRNEWQEDLLASKRNLDKVYFEELEEMKNNFLKGGDLKAAVAAQNAIDQRDNDEKEPAELIKLRTTYKTSTNAERKKITKRYYEELSKLKKAYMEATDLKNSIAVDSEMKKVADQYKNPEPWRPRRNTTSKGAKSKGADNFKGFQIEFVTIGNPGNKGDDRPPLHNPSPIKWGAVSYIYRMGKYEVSEAMIDAYNKYSDGPKISTTSRGPDKPAGRLSWNEMARFVNWLNTSQGHHVAYKFETSGANDDISLWSSADAWQLGGENLFRHKDAKYFLPSEHEFYKAAYYDSKTGTYNEYTTGAAKPTGVSSGVAANTAVFHGKTNPKPPGPADITQAGGLSPYGTMAQGGNVWEYLESALDGCNDSPSEFRTRLSGGWANGSFTFKAKVRHRTGTKESQYADAGFRVASVAD